MEERNNLTELKARVNAVNMALGVMLTDLTNQAHAKKRSDAVAHLQALRPSFAGTPYASQIDNLCQFAMGDDYNAIKKKIHELATDMTRQITKDLTTNMNAIKALKKTS